MITQRRQMATVREVFNTPSKYKCLEDAANSLNLNRDKNNLILITTFDYGCPTRPNSWIKEFLCFERNKEPIIHIV